MLNIGKKYGMIEKLYQKLMSTSEFLLQVPEVV